MSSSKKSLLLENISRFGLDSRIGKVLLSIKGTGIRVGEHVSRFSGHSPVIMDYGNYIKGDPIKDIDWKLSARTENLYVKIREGYRQTDFVIAVDDSESMRVSYDNSHPSKYITALTIAYLTAKIALNSRDRISFIWNGEKVSANTEQSMMDLLLKMENTSSTVDLWGTNFDVGTNIFIISDFFVEYDNFINFLKHVSSVSKNLSSFIIQDPVEKELDLTGRFKFLDPEADNSILAESEKIQERYQKYYQQHFQGIASKFKRYAVPNGIVLTDSDPFKEFIKVLS